MEARSANPENPRRTDAPGGDSGPAWILLPREPGAWGMLLAPFVAAAILGRAWTLELLAGLAAILLAFVIREPLTFLARQKRV